MRCEKKGFSVQGPGFRDKPSNAVPECFVTDSRSAHATAATPLPLNPEP
jgi:hypothetical protein